MIGQIHNGKYKHVKSLHGCDTCEVAPDTDTCRLLSEKEYCGIVTCFSLVNTLRMQEHHQNFAMHGDIIKHTITGDLYEAVFRDMSRPRVDGDSPDNGATLQRFAGSPLPYVDGLEYHPVSKDMVCSYTDIVYRRVMQRVIEPNLIFKHPATGNSILRSIEVKVERHSCSGCVGDTNHVACLALPHCAQQRIYAEVATDESS